MKVSPKEFWGYIRLKTKCKTGIPDLKDSDGNIIRGDDDEADLLSDFFSSVFVIEPPRTLPIFKARNSVIP